MTEPSLHNDNNNNNNANNNNNNNDNIGIETRVTELQKTVILHSARILRKVLEISEILLMPNRENTLPLTLSE